MRFMDTVKVALAALAVVAATVLVSATAGYAHHTTPIVQPPLESWEVFDGKCTDAQWNAVTKRAKKVVRKQYNKTHQMPWIEVSTPPDIAAGIVRYCLPVEARTN